MLSAYEVIERNWQETYLAKHMQKHSDRPDKRPPVSMNQGGVAGAAAVPGAGGHGGTHGGGGGQNNLGPASQAAAASAAAAAGLPGLAGSAADAYWPKMDPYGSQDAHLRDYGLMDPRLNPHAHRDMVDPRHQGRRCSMLVTRLFVTCSNFLFGKKCDYLVIFEIIAFRFNNVTRLK